MIGILIEINTPNQIAQIGRQINDVLDHLDEDEDEEIERSS
jgi:hypothetical protein